MPGRPSSLNMKPFAFAAAIFVLCCAPASAGDYLEPESNMTNPVDAYYASVLTVVYREAYAPLVVARMIAHP